MNTSQVEHDAEHHEARKMKYYCALCFWGRLERLERIVKLDAEGIISEETKEL